MPITWVYYITCIESHLISWRRGKINNSFISCLFFQCISETRIRKHGSDREFSIKCTASLPEHIPVIPWCTLVLEDTPAPHSDCAFVQHHRLNGNNGDTVSKIKRKYEQFSNLKALLILADKTKSQLLQEAEDNPSLKDCRFPIVIVSNEYRQQLTSFVGRGKEYLTVSIYPLVSSEMQRDTGNCQCYTYVA